MEFQWQLGISLAGVRLDKQRGPGCPRRRFGYFFAEEKVTRGMGPGRPQQQAPQSGGGEAPSINPGVRGCVAPDDKQKVRGRSPRRKRKREVPGRLAGDFFYSSPSGG